MKMILEMWASWLMLLLLLLAAIVAEAAGSDVKPGCKAMCGNVSVPYPFGIGKLCALNEYFSLKCSSDQLVFGKNFPVRNITVLNSTLIVSVDAASDCYDKSGNSIGRFEQNMTIEHGPFMFSSTRNKFTVVGCDTVANVVNRGVTYGAACLSLCNEYVNLTEKGDCSGSGCCQISIPQGLNSLVYSVSSYDNYTDVSDFNRCGYAFLADVNSLKFSDWNLSRVANGTSDVAIEWVVKNETCEDAIADPSTYACGLNTDCFPSEKPQGYRCSCRKGFQGNPYLKEGCQDINECEDPVNNPCKGKCKNNFGNYTCQCSFGMHGDGKTGCQLSSVIPLVAGVGLAISLVIIGLLLYVISRKRRKDKNFRENGGMVLKNQRVKIFSEAELAIATNNYDEDQKIGEGGFGYVYKGVLSDNTQVAVKKSKGVDKAQMNEDFQHEIGTVSQVNHKNVVKLVGLCLETNVPLLVYEFISNGTLFKHIHDKRSQILTSWRNRLRIASESALALDYLHSLADPPVIHGDVKSVNILLDNNYTAKIADFGASVFISQGRANIATKIQGTFGYLDPEYLMTGNLTEKSDVYSFGVVLVELLTGEVPNSNSKSGEKRNIIQHFISALNNNDLPRILDFQAANEGEMDEIEEVAVLAKRCVNSVGIDRPTMKEVSNELAKLKDLHEMSWAQQNSEETEHLLGESSDSFLENGSAPMSHSQCVISLEIEKYTDSI